jgi:hypothetical protein
MNRKNVDMKYTTPWNRVLFAKMVVSVPFTESKDSSPFLQVLVLN